MQPPPRQRTAEEERARAAAKQAEKELWERTRGAGSAVFKLAESGRLKPRQQRRHYPSASGSNDNRHSASLPDLLDTLKTDDTHATSSGGDDNKSNSNSSHKRTQQSAATSSQVDNWSAEDVLPSLDEVEAKLYEPVEVPSADVLLSRGICDYTLLPKTLGRGKFSTVFVASKNGELVAIKHTALFPHHQLIATRLLREPTLLAELPPHPNLVTVRETIRTPGHFYLVEEYLDGYVTLEALLPILCPTPPHILPSPAAERILTQLLSAVRAIHHPLQICHRDIKPENILVHPDTLQLKLLDFGLATHFSKSEAKLSTCCGSPAFHCPEIVKALASPPGSVVYMGPEVDAWTCGVTMLRCLTGARFPLGASHSSLRGMSIRAQRAVSTISDQAMREKIGALLDMDGNRRMKRFEEMVVEQERELGEPDRSQKKFKSTSFIPAPPTHSINLPIIESDAGTDQHFATATGYSTPVSASRRSTPSNSRAPSPSRFAPTSSTTFVALNPTNQPPDRVVSFVKYCLRCAGILHHTWPDFSGLSKSNRHSFLGPHPSQTTTSVSAAFAEAVGMPLDALTTPSTPLFPPTFAGHEDRSDGYGHVQVFQCVIELPEEREVTDGGGGPGQMSLVQSIMAAFGRKTTQSPTMSSSPSNASGRPQGNARKASSPSPGMRPTGTRSLSTPAQPRTANADKAGSMQKDGPVRCLAFHLIVRFPRQQHPASVARHAMSRATSYFGQANAAQPSRSSRSRASSAAGKLTVEGKGEEDHFRDGRGGRDASPHSEGRRHVLAREESLDNLTSLNTASAEAQQQFPRASNRSPSTSRPASRTRKRSSRGLPKRAKVYFQVSDERALMAVREALSVGGTVDARDFDDNPRSSSHLPTHTTDSGSDPHDPTTPRGTRVRRRTRDMQALQAMKPNALSSSSAAAAIGAGALSEAEWSTPTSPSIPLPADSSALAKDEEPRGRSMTSNRARNESTDTVVGHSSGGMRAPSQLSTVALKEESPTNDDFHQTIDSLTRTLGEIVSGNMRASSTTSSSSSSPLARSAVSSPHIEHPQPLSTELSPFYDGRQDGMLAQTRSLLLDVSRILHYAERRGTGSVQETLSPVLFPLFAALSPALGLVPSEKMGLPASTTAKEEASESTTLRGLAMASMDVVARHASPREVIMAIQERLEVLSTHGRKEEAEEPSSPSEGSATTSLGVDLAQPARSVGSGVEKEGLSSRTPKPWMASLEVAGILRVMSLAVMRLQTNKPVNFVEPLINLVPRTARNALQSDVTHEPTVGHPYRESSTSLSSMSPITPKDANASHKRQDSRSNSTASSGTQSLNSNGSRKNSAPHTAQSNGGTPASHIELAACEISLSVVALCRSLADWVASKGAGAAESSTHAAQKANLTLFYAAMIALLPTLPRPDGYTYLSEWYFHIWKPRYNVVRPQAAPTSRSLVRHPRLETLSKQVWSQLNDFVAYLHIDVESDALGRAQLAGDEQDTATSATRTMGALMLHVNLLARSAQSSDAHEPCQTTKGPGWAADVALGKLQRSMGLLVACLGSEPPATISKDGLRSLGGSAHLPDVALTWAVWCIEGMCSDGSATTTARLNSEEAILFVQAIAAHAALSPRPAARQMSILLVQIALERLTDDAIARDLLIELITESPYPQLRAASVGLARTLISTELDQISVTASQNESPPSDARFVRHDFLDRIAGFLFSMPDGVEDLLSAAGKDEPDATVAVLGNIKTFVEDNGAWLSECLAFVYLVLSKDKTGASGIRRTPTLQDVDDRLLRPLHTCLQLFKQHLQSHTLQTRSTTATEANEVGLAVEMLEVALVRAQDAVRTAQDAI